jgi:hypothetical protein
VRIVLTFSSSELIRSTLLRLLVLLFIALSAVPAAVLGQGVEKDVCPRPRAGSIVPEPSDLRSESGVLRVELTYTNFRDALGQMHYCYRDNGAVPARHCERWILGRQKRVVSERQVADGFPESAARRDLRLPLPPVGARRRRYDGHDPRGHRLPRSGRALDVFSAGHKRGVPFWRGSSGVLKSLLPKGRPLYLRRVTAQIEASCASRKLRPI